MIGATDIDHHEVFVLHRLFLMPLAIVFAASSGSTQTAKPSVAQPLTRAVFIATMDSEYRKLDTNRDQIVTKIEIEANQRNLQSAAAARRARAVFSQVDTDRNGQISIDEFVRANATTSKVDGSAIMGRLDSNRDQKVTLVEYRILTLTNFDRIDTDRDGVLTTAEQRAQPIPR